MEHVIMDDLGYKGLKIFRKTGGYAYGTDAVLLASFVRAKPSERAVDLCAGSGIIAVLVNGRTGAHVTAVEIDPELSELTRRTAAENAQQNVEAVSCDIADAPALLGCGRFDLCVSNPPYYADGESGDIATHQIACDIFAISRAAAALLRNGGRFFICYPAGKLAEAVYAIKSNGLEPKRLRLVKSTPAKEPYLLLMEAKKGGGTGLIIEDELVLRDCEGKDTKELKRIYHIE